MGPALVEARVVPDGHVSNQSRWPTDPVWKLLQSATFAEAPAEARRLIRRKQRGGEVKALDDMQYGCLASRVAKLHPNGGQWTLSRALGEVAGALEAIEAKKTMAGQDFGELVRERRRQRGLPLPIVDRVLPFRSKPTDLADDVPLTSDDPSDGASPKDPYTRHVVLAERRVTEAFVALEAAELSGAPHRSLDRLETLYVNAALTRSVG